MDAVEMLVDDRRMLFEPVNSFSNLENIEGRETIRVIKDPRMIAVDEPTFARAKDVDFKDGVIEVDVLSRLQKTAPEFARGFIGVAFRIDESDSKFECIYIRPTNGRSDDQVRRNRSIQYFSYPEYKFDRFRAESPGKYETYADMGLNEWMRMKIIVNGSSALLYLNGSRQPVFVVHDLKHGSGSSGGIGLWVDIGTEGYFAALSIQHTQ